MSPVDYRDQPFTMSSNDSAISAMLGKGFPTLMGAENYHTWKEAVVLVLDSRKVFAHANGTRKVIKLNDGEFETLKFAERVAYENLKVKHEDDDALARTILILSISTSIHSLYKTHQTNDARQRLGSDDPLFGLAPTDDDVRGTAHSLWKWITKEYGRGSNLLSMKSLEHLISTVCPADGDPAPWFASMTENAAIFSARPLDPDQLLCAFLLRGLNGRFPYLVATELAKGKDITSAAIISSALRQHEQETSQQQQAVRAKALAASYSSSAASKAPSSSSAAATAGSSSSDRSRDSSFQKIIDTRPPKDLTKICPLHGGNFRGHDTSGCDKERSANSRGLTWLAEDGTPLKEAIPLASGSKAKANVVTVNVVSSPSSPSASSASDPSVLYNVDSFLASAFSSSVSSSPLPASFTADSGSTHHLCNDYGLLVNPRPAKGIVTVGNSSSLSATHIGMVVIQDTNGPFLLHDVLFVPGLSRNLLSTTKLNNEGFRVSFEKDLTFAVRDDQDRVLLVGHSVDGLPLLDGLALVQRQPLALITSSSVTHDDLAAYHRSLGHTHVRAVADLLRDGRLAKVARVVPTSVIDAFECSSCIRGKTGRLPAPRTDTRAEDAGALLRADLWGPARTATPAGRKYMLVCQDDATSKVWVFFLAKKSEARAHVQQVVSLIKTQLGRTIRRLHSNMGGEFIVGSLETYLIESGIEHTLSPAGNHSQNSRLERVMLTLLNGVRTVLLETGLPPSFWAEAASYIAYVRNRSPSAATGKLPEDAYRGYPVRLTHLRAFGTPLFYRLHTESNKLSPRYAPGLLMGYVEVGSAYRVYDPSTKAFHHTRDVVFTKKAPLSSTPSPHQQDVYDLFELPDLLPTSSDTVPPLLSSPSDSPPDGPEPLFPSPSVQPGLDSIGQESQEDKRSTSSALW